MINEEQSRPLTPQEEVFYKTLFNHYCDRIRTLPHNKVIRAGYKHYKHIFTTQKIITSQTNNESYATN